MKLPFRRVLFWLHLIVGVAAGIVILTMSVTGVLLMYERQVQTWADEHSFHIAANGAQRLTPEELLKAFRDQRHVLPNSVVFRAQPDRPVQFVIGRNKTFYADPYTGKILGEASQPWQNFFRKVTVWHRWLGAEGPGVRVYRSITGICNAGFLVLVVSGIYLWFPRKWTRSSVRAVTWFRGGLSGKARDFNWHNTIGLWTAIPLFFVVLSGVVMSYPWANALLFRAMGSTPSAQGGPGGPRGGREEGAPRGAGFEGRRRRGEGRGASRQGTRELHAEREPARGEGRAPRRRADRAEGGRAGIPDVETPPADLSLAGINQTWAVASVRLPGWRSISLRLPSSEGAALAYSINTGADSQPATKSTLTLSPEGKVLRWETYDQIEPGRRARTWIRFVHTGEYYGFAGQTIAGLASAGGAMLVWTGISLALRRLWAWNRRRRSASKEPVTSSA